jgi:hypothetical protein
MTADFPPQQMKNERQKVRHAIDHILWVHQYFLSASQRRGSRCRLKSLQERRPLSAAQGEGVGPIHSGNSLHTSVNGTNNDRLSAGRCCPREAFRSCGSVQVERSAEHQVRISL